MDIMDHITLHHTDIIPKDGAYHLTRAALDSRRPQVLHTHDFFELLWVQNGIVRHHTPDGRADLSEGDMLFVRSDHIHGLQGRGEEALVVSISLSDDLIAQIGQRHRALLGRFFWSDSPTPVTTHRDMRQLAQLNAAALRLERSQPSAFEAEAFLLPLLTSLLDGAPDLPKVAPQWLLDACAAAQDPAVFRDGAAGFVAVAGRAHPHVSRTTRAYLGQSPSEYINALRMGYAARRLSGTGETLSEIATDCGIPNLSHFHKLFLAHHGQTPQRYRRARQRNVLQPAAA
jgi:AraC family cel operon transcriptional repressor